MKKDDLFFNRYPKLPQLYMFGIYLFAVTVILIFIGIFIIYDFYFKESRLKIFSLNGSEMLMIGYYLIACATASGASIMGVIYLGSNPSNFFVVKKTEEGSNTYNIEKRLPESIFYTGVSIWVLFLINESVQLFFSWLIIITTIINIVCFTLIEYYKKIIKSQKKETKE